jgi:hypothetical protein
MERRTRSGESRDGQRWVPLVIGFGDIRPENA